MIQQRAIQKNHDDDHYCVCLYKHPRDMAVTFKKHVAFVSTDNKSKIKIGEPDCLIFAVTCGRQVIVANGHVVHLLIITFLH